VEAPPDWSENIEEYLQAEKRIKDLWKKTRHVIVLFFSSFRLHPFLREPASKTIPPEMTMVHAENL